MIFYQKEREKTFKDRKILSLTGLELIKKHLLQV